MSVRLLVVTQYFWPENFRINELVAGLVRRGHAVTVLTGLPNYPSGRFFEGYSWRGPWRDDYAGATVVRVPLLPRGGGGAMRLFLNYVSFVLSGIWGALFRLRGSFDAIFVFETSPITVGIPAAVARRRFRAPVLFWVLDLWPDSLAATGAVRSRTLLAAVDRLVRWIYARCERVLVQSRAFVPEIVRHGVPPPRVLYFPNWVETEYQAVDIGSTDRPPLPAGFRVMYAGNIGAAQDFPAILAAAETLKARADVYWLIVGDGRMGEWVRKEVRERGLESQVHFLGQQPSETMPYLFAAADALLVSLKREPIFALTIPGKLQSYLAGGRPILAMLDGEGARVVKEAGAGLVCPAGDAKALAAHVERMAALSRVEREQFGVNGRRYAETHFGRQRLFDQLEEWMNEAAQERRRQADLKETGPL